MNFNLFNFWIPLIVIIQIHYLLPCKRWKNLCLLIVSWTFYILVDWRVFPCLLISTVTDYIAGFLVTPSKKKSSRLTALFCSLLINLGLLFNFKYIPELFQTNSDFISLLKSIGLPLGISFYTFQTISYTLDCYRGHIKPASDFLSFALYVSFFPQIAAGPIEKARRLLSQFQKPVSKMDIQQFKEGFYLVLLGLFKKVYVAGALTHPLKRIYETAEAPPSLALLSGILSVLLFYADFSAYSDLARGIAKFFGIDLIVNFKPFIFSKNPIEFWRAWHISLTEWIRDYCVKPFVNLVSKTRYKSFINLHIIIIFVIFGLWHRANMVWLIFGFFNAFSYLIYYFLHKKISFSFRFIKFLFMFSLMFTFYTINGLLAYSDDLQTFLNTFYRIMKFDGFGRETFDLLFYLFPFIFPLFIYEWFQNKHGTELFILKTPFLIRAFWVAFVLACVFIFDRGAESSFIYFGF